MSYVAMTIQYPDGITVGNIVPMNKVCDMQGRGYKRAPVHSTPKPTAMPAITLGDTTADLFYGRMLFNNNAIMRA